MSTQPLTFADVLEGFHEVKEMLRETAKTVDSLGKSVGTINERLFADESLTDQFYALGHKVKAHSRRKVFGKGTPNHGEIDLLLEDGNVAILVEAKTTLKIDDVYKHIERLEKYRRFVDEDGKSEKHFIGAVAGTMIAENVKDFAHENGLYVIIQSAKAVEILDSPEGFKPKEW
jgi:hypothetical protein